MELTVLVVMPPSALARLCESQPAILRAQDSSLLTVTASLDIPGPWTFQLRNPRNPTEYVTHGGVLEFIASEGVVHLPAWVSCDAFILLQCGC